MHAGCYIPKFPEQLNLYLKRKTEEILFALYAACLRQKQRDPHNYYVNWEFSCTLSHIMRLITESHRTEQSSHALDLLYYHQSETG